MIKENVQGSKSESKTRSKEKGKQENKAWIREMHDKLINMEQEQQGI